MKFCFGIFVSILFSSLAGVVHADTIDLGKKVIQGFIQVRPDHDIYVDYIKAKPGQQTIVLLNGLTYTTVQWEKFAQPLFAEGYGVLRFDFDGMGETLLKYAPALKAFDYKQQVEDVKNLLIALQVPKPYNFVGFSYGGGISLAFIQKYPNELKHLILMAPFTEPINKQDTWINSQIWLTRQMFPFNPASDDELYDFFLRELAYSTYPQAEPIVLTNPFKLEATFRLAQGIRKWRPIDFPEILPPRSLHLVVAGKDQYLEKEVLNKYWDKVPVNAHASRIVINGSEHKMPEAAPRFAASWVIEIMKDNPLLFVGDTFEGYPSTGQAISKTAKLALKKDK